MTTCTARQQAPAILSIDRLEVWNPGTLPPSLTLEKLRRAHASVPANPLLAEPMYLAGYIERMGTGTRDMIRRCIEAGLPEPEFTASGEFRTIVRRPLLPRPELYPGPHLLPRSGPSELQLPREETDGAREETGGIREEPSGKTSGKTSGLILEMIRQQPDITIPEMAEALGRSTRAIEMQLAKLKKSGKVQRIGPAKGGRWEIVGGDAP